MSVRKLSAKELSKHKELSNKATVCELVRDNAKSKVDLKRATIEAQIILFKEERERLLLQLQITELSKQSCVRELESLKKVAKEEEGILTESLLKAKKEYEKFGLYINKKYGDDIVSVDQETGELLSV